MANRKGTAYVTAKAQEQPVVVTSHNKPVSVTLSPEHYDEMVRSVRETQAQVLASAAALVADRATLRPLEEARNRLGRT
ncbi:type II toxin-antitoxin system prevent-host-death family antitoxin [Microbacterium sp. A93]|uniref:type II toxin-antitoxin system prevent-host-death family antitoxin n=1 Tax=Microbacterium sp. A93 TaxID=3450716 RepID=UPI003F441EF8